MNFQFTNNGKTYSISNSCCGGNGFQKIYYGYYLNPHLVNANLVNKNRQVGLFFKREKTETVLELVYCDNETNQTQCINISPQEYELAKNALEFLQTKIAEDNSEKSKRDAMMSSLDKAFNSQDPNETVKVYFDDGTFEEYKTYCTKVSNPEWCLVVDGGKTYHTRYGCFHKWSDEYKKGFVSWKAMRTDEAIKQGMGLCNFCMKADMPLDFEDDDANNNEDDFEME